MGGVASAGQAARRRRRRPHGVSRRALGQAGDTAQVGRRVLEDRLALLGVAAAGGGVVGVDRAAVPGGHDARGLRHRAIGEGVLGGPAAVHLAGRRRAHVVALRGVVPEVGQGVAARGDRLGLERLDLGKGFRGQLVRDHPAQVVLEVHDVDGGQPARVRGPHLEDPPIGAGVGPEELVRPCGGDRGLLELVPGLDEAQPSGPRPGDEGRAGQRPQPHRRLAGRAPVNDQARGRVDRHALDGDQEADADPRLEHRRDGVGVRSHHVGRRRRGRDSRLHRAAGDGHDPRRGQRRDPGGAGVSNDAFSDQEPCGPSL